MFARPRDLRIGTFAEYIAIDQDDVAPKPAALSLHEAAAVPLVALAAWQMLVDRAHVQPGQKVLVHAGTGGWAPPSFSLLSTSEPTSRRPRVVPRNSSSAFSVPMSSSTTVQRISPRPSQATTSVLRKDAEPS